MANSMYPWYSPIARQRHPLQNSTPHQRQRKRRTAYTPQTARNMAQAYKSVLS